eukprot:gene8471-9337_t
MGSYSEADAEEDASILVDFASDLSRDSLGIHFERSSLLGRSVSKFGDAARCFSFGAEATTAELRSLLDACSNMNPRLVNIPLPQGDGLARRRDASLENAHEVGDLVEAKAFFLKKRLPLMIPLRLLGVPEEVIGESSLRQLRKDIERDQLLLNGKLLSGAALGLDGVLQALRDDCRALLHLAFPEVCIRNFCVSALMGASRTHTGTVALAAIQTVADLNDYMLIPVPAWTPPVRLTLHLGATEEEVPGFCWGLVASWRCDFVYELRRHESLDDRGVDNYDDSSIERVRIIYEDAAVLDLRFSFGDSNSGESGKVLFGSQSLAKVYVFGCLEFWTEVAAAGIAFDFKPLSIFESLWFAMVRILTVGCGFTGAAFQHLLSGLLPSSPQVVMETWEAAPVTGGRMETYRYYPHHQADSGIYAQYDLGAQYFSWPSDQQPFSSLCRDLEEKALLREFDPRSGLVLGISGERLNRKHYYAPQGTASLVSHLAASSSSSVFCSRRVSSIDRRPDGSFLVTAHDEGEGDIAKVFDIVAVTAPSPELHPLLREVSFSSRVTLGVVYDLSAAEFDNVLSSVSWRACYLSSSSPILPQDDVLRYVSIENFKFEDRFPSQKTSAERKLLSVVLQSSVEYGANIVKLMKEATGPEMRAILEKEVTQQLLSRLGRLLPALPHAEAPLHTHLRLYSQSQVTKPIVWQTQPCFVERHGRSLLLLAGDFFTESSFLGCLHSAEAAAHVVANHLAASSVTMSD